MYIFRIVKDGKIHYKIQHKRWLGWSDSYCNELIQDYARAEELLHEKIEVNNTKQPKEGIC